MTVTIDIVIQEIIVSVFQYLLSNIKYYKIVITTVAKVILSLPRYSRYKVGINFDNERLNTLKTLWTLNLFLVLVLLSCLYHHKFIFVVEDDVVDHEGEKTKRKERHSKRKNKRNKEKEGI